jgi:hypothetical protein
MDVNAKYFNTQWKYCKIMDWDEKDNETGSMGKEKDLLTYLINKKNNYVRNK